MLKAIGAVLVIASCSAIGLKMSGDLKTRMNQLVLLKRMLLMLRGEIRYAKTPLPEAFDSIGKRIGNCFGEFLTGLAQKLTEQSGQPFQQLWKEAVDDNLTETKLAHEDKEQLKNMGENLGYLDSDMQINTIDLQVEQLELQLQRLEKGISGKTRVYNCLGVFCGILIAILLL